MPDPNFPIVTPAECKGRNGWFKYHHITVTAPIGDGPGWVNIHSSRKGREAPIIFRGTRAQLRDMFTEILTQLEKPDVKDT